MPSVGPRWAVAAMLENHILGSEVCHHQTPLVDGLAGKLSLKQKEQGESCEGSSPGRSPGTAAVLLFSRGVSQDQHGAAEQETAGKGLP